MKDPKQAGKANLANLISVMNPTRRRDDTDQVFSGDDASENDLDGYDSDSWAKASDPSSPGDSTLAPRPRMDLQELATKAVSHALGRSDPIQIPTGMRRGPEGRHLPLAIPESLPRHDAPPPLRNITLPSHDFYPGADHFSPRQTGGPPIPLASPRSIDARSPTNSIPASESELPPLNSPSSGVSWLPSVKELMISEPPAGTPGREADPPPPLHSASFSHPRTVPGPLSVPPLRPSSISGPSPTSQDGVHPGELPSPLRAPAMGSYYYTSPQAGGDAASLPRLAADYRSNSADSPPEYPAPAPAESDATSEPGTYKCPFEGCQARPFQTQYLLNSHANVHSLERPHYCPVQGCPRSKAGQGFKRKNEMIRHGFVHRSPGYACPFCPDREHKYPRPDNLQR